MKYEKFDILKKAKYSIIPNNRELYIVYVECERWGLYERYSRI